MLTQFTFNKENFDNGYSYRPINAISKRVVVVDNKLKPDVCPPSLSPIPVVNIKKNNSGLFTPFNKDKLFWSFFIILKGYEEYELSRINAFTIEKKMKIETVEQLKTIKDKLKELKLKRTELEDELVNKQTITVKGLTALCVLYDISITYIFGRKFCIINPTDTTNKHIIIQNSKKEDSLLYDSEEIDIKKIQEEYWFIENIQKPLNAPSAYTIKELHLICERLQIDIHTTVNEKTKLKTKKQVYEEILQHL